MNKFALFFFASLLTLFQLSAQCPITLGCFPDALPICDQTGNNPTLWNASYWWDALVESHDLADSEVNLSITAQDDCSNGNFTFKYLLFLDLDGDGAQETVVSSDNLPSSGTVNYDNINTPNYSGGTPRIFDRRLVPTIFKFRFSMQTLVKGGQIGVARLRWYDKMAGKYVFPQLPYGTHRIRWTVTNSAGNQTECEYSFTIKDCAPPTVACSNNLSTFVFSNGATTIWAGDFLQYLTDNHTPASQIQLAVSGSDGTSWPLDSLGNPVTSLTFDCDDLGVNEIILWAQDAYGNISFCETTLILSDPSGNCTNNPEFTLCSNAACNGVPLEEVNFEVFGTSAPGFPPLNLFFLSNKNGCGDLNSVPSDYVNHTFVQPSKDDNPLYGVSAYDLVLISKHIIGIEPFTEPWQWVAADADNNGIIDTFDIIELRNLLYGIYDELPNNASWRFYRSDHIFPPGNPLSQPIPSSALVADFLTDPTLKFLGVKVGDVDCHSIPNGFNNPEMESRIQSTSSAEVTAPQPNPTTGGATISIHLEQPENVSLEVSDFSGKIIFQQKIWLEKGAQVLEIPAVALREVGIYIWRFQMGKEIQSGKIVKL